MCEHCAPHPGVSRQPVHAICCLAGADLPSLTPAWHICKQLAAAAAESRCRVARCAVSAAARRCRRWWAGRQSWACWRWPALAPPAAPPRLLPGALRAVAAGLHLAARRATRAHQGTGRLAAHSGAGTLPCCYQQTVSAPHTQRTWWAVLRRRPSDWSARCCASLLAAVASGCHRCDRLACALKPELGCAWGWAARRLSAQGQLPDRDDSSRARHTPIASPSAAGAGEGRLISVSDHPAPDSAPCHVPSQRCRALESLFSQPRSTAQQGQSGQAASLEAVPGCIMGAPCLELSRLIGSPPAAPPRTKIAPLPQASPEAASTSGG